MRTTQLAKTAKTTGLLQHQAGCRKAGRCPLAGELPCLAVSVLSRPLAAKLPQHRQYHCLTPVRSRKAVVPRPRASRGRRPQSSSDDDEDDPEYDPTAHEADAADGEAFVVDLTLESDSDDDADAARREVRTAASRLL